MCIEWKLVFPISSSFHFNRRTRHFARFISQICFQISVKYIFLIFVTNYEFRIVFRYFLIKKVIVIGKKQKNKES